MQLTDNPLPIKAGQGAFTFIVGPTDAGKRLDVLLAARLSDCSRSHIAHLIADGRITVQGSVKKPGYRLKDGERVNGTIPPPELPTVDPEPIPIEILYEDPAMIVINKQPGLVVHPAPGHAGGTLVNALLHHCRVLGSIGGRLRPGIVHRLDKDTSGCLVAAKNEPAHQHLSAQFKTRTVRKRYLALVCGRIAENSGKVLLSVGRHPIDRKKMSVQSRKARAAETHWTVRERFGDATLLELDLRTGRTHQIRVHCAAIGHPVVGDTVYGGSRRLESLSRNNQNRPQVPRQMLHAWILQLLHPMDERRMVFEAPLPADMARLLATLRNGGA